VHEQLRIQILSLQHMRQCSLHGVTTCGASLAVTRRNAVSITAAWRSSGPRAASATTCWAWTASRSCSCRWGRSRRTRCGRRGWRARRAWCRCSRCRSDPEVQIDPLQGVIYIHISCSKDSDSFRVVASASDCRLDNRDSCCPTMPVECWSKPMRAFVYTSAVELYVDVVGYAHA